MEPIPDERPSHYDQLAGTRPTAETTVAWSPQASTRYRPRNVMFTYELARRLEAAGVTATVLYPGVTRTAFAAEGTQSGQRG